MKNGSIEIDKQKNDYVAMGLIIGAAIGTLLFLFTKQPWHIAAGAGIGIVTGAIVVSDSNY